MAWTAPTVRSTGDLITSSIWNVDLKANLDYLKAEADKHDDVTVNDVTGSRAIDGTVYQNTSGKIKIVTVVVECETNDAGSSIVAFLCDSGTPPTTDIGSVRLYAGASALGGVVEVRQAFTFVVPPSYYYKATGSTQGGGVAPVLDEWFEYDFL